MPHDSCSLLQIQRYSQVLGRHVHLNALVPEGASSPAAVLLLHGMCDDENTWLRRTCLERYLLGRALAVIIPNGEHGWWCDSPRGAFESLAQETCDYAQDLLRLRPGRWGIMGNSMGGYGALRLGLRHPDRFASIVALAPAVDLQRILAPHDLSTIFPQGYGAKDDPRLLAAGLVAHPRRTAVHLLCGSEDTLFGDHQMLHQHLTALGYNHRQGIRPGGHFWDTWDAFLPTALTALGQDLQSECVATSISETDV
jgi:S-formylglutathione hydrolase FrmB